MGQDDEQLLPRLRGYAREFLRHRMREISERLYAAGWHSYLEYDLWAAIQPGVEPTSRLRRLPATERSDLLQLARDAGVWWRWEEGQMEESSISLEVWEALFGAEPNEPT